MKFDFDFLYMYYVIVPVICGCMPTVVYCYVQSKVYITMNLNKQLFTKDRLHKFTEHVGS